jgi:cytochrome c-type biogenesis protein CcmH/NrfG
MEPPYWYLPMRHMLGKALLDAGRPVDAEATYREELRLRPHDGWALIGLANSLSAQGDTDDATATRAELAATWTHADIAPADSEL